MFKRERVAVLNTYFPHYIIEQNGKNQIMYCYSSHDIVQIWMIQLPIEHGPCVIFTGECFQRKVQSWKILAQNKV